MKIKHLLVLVWLMTVIACRDETATWSRALTGGDSTRGKIALSTYGCVACHSIPGVPGSNALTAPPLIGISHRSYLAGMLQNPPENLERWIQHPRPVNPRTAMPEQGVTDQDARDIAAYLYTTRGKRRVLKIRSPFHILTRFFIQRQSSPRQMCSIIIRGSHLICCPISVTGR